LLELTYTLPLNPKQSRAVLHLIAMRKGLTPEDARTFARAFVEAGPASLGVPEQLVPQVANFVPPPPARTSPAEGDPAGLLETANAVAAALKVERGGQDTLVIDSESS